MENVFTLWERAEKVGSEVVGAIIWAIIFDMAQRRRDIQIIWMRRKEYEILEPSMDRVFVKWQDREAVIPVKNISRYALLDCIKKAKFVVGKENFPTLFINAIYMGGAHKIHEIEIELIEEINQLVIGGEINLFFNEMTRGPAKFYLDQNAWWNIQGKMNKLLDMLVDKVHSLTRC